MLLHQQNAGLFPVVCIAPQQTRLPRCCPALMVSLLLTKGGIAPIVVPAIWDSTALYIVESTEVEGHWPL